MLSTNVDIDTLKSFISLLASKSGTANGMNSVNNMFFNTEQATASVPVYGTFQSLNTNANLVPMVDARVIQVVENDSIDDANNDNYVMCTTETTLKC
jgi:hypothetical protein